MHENSVHIPSSLEIIKKKNLEKFVLSYREWHQVAQSAYL